MAEKDKGAEQVTVRLDPDLRAAIEQQAQREHRTLSGQIRHLVTIAFAQQQRAAA